MKTLAVNGPSLSLLGLALLFLFPNWIMLSNLLFGGFFHEVVATYGEVRPLPVMFGESWPFALVYGGIAAAQMLLFFRMIALSLPIQTAKAAITTPGSEARPHSRVRYGPSSRGRWRAKAR